MKAIIVEDEFAPRETLKAKLAENHPDIQVIAACENAETALIDILRLKPDLIFLDIQLPGNNGLWLAEQLITLTCDTFVPPQVIFTTAFTDSAYLLKAFALAAVDYLIKPVAVDSLAKAVERCRQRQKSNTGLQTLMDTLDNEHLLRFRNYSGLLLLRPDDITCIRADGNYSVITLDDGKTEDIFESLGEIERRLPTDIFIRTGRSQIVNRRYIRKINTRKSSVTIVTPHTSFDLEVPENGIKALKN
jgi:DNA-binding LytR/AlgR family response regulator